MSDFISLNCPACGGKLNVGKNSSVVICEYCEREHIVRRQDDGAVTLESFAQCPKCGRNDRVEKVSAIIRKEHNATNQSDLARLLTPPEKPDLLPEPELQTVKMAENNYSISAIIFLGFSVLGLLVIFIQLINAGFDSENLICIIPTLFLIGLTWFFKKKSEETKVEIAEEYQQNLKVEQKKNQETVVKVIKYNNALQNNWKTAIERWERLYYCNRDDCIFMPGEDWHTKIDEMEKIIIKGLPKPTIDKALKAKILNQSSSTQQQKIRKSKEGLTQNQQTKIQHSHHSVINRCPNCGSTNVSGPKRENMSCIWLIFIFISWGLGLIFWFFTPKYITCNNCGAKWRA